MKYCFALTNLFLCLLVYGQCYIKEVPSYGIALNTTGSKKLDKILNKEARQLENLFSVQIELWAYDDGESPNALAIDSDPYTIMLGKGLLLDEYVNTNNSYSIIAIMAHEFAHTVQYKFKYYGNGKEPELHADYLAGWYMGKKKYLTSDEVDKISSSFWDKGDINYFSPDHHGTSEERQKSFKAGFLNSKLNIQDAYLDGMKFVKSLVPLITEKPNEIEDKNNPYPNLCKYPSPIPNEIIQTVNNGNSYYLKGDFKECAKNYDQLIINYPNYCVGYFNRGLALYYSGNKELALIDFQKALDLGLMDAKRIINQLF
jgi:tetratricopeptide (TPR) repeat protein